MADYFKKGAALKMKKKDLREEIIITTLFTLICAVILFPFLLLVSVSLSSEKNISDFGYNLIPKAIDFSAYKYIFTNFTSIVNAYGVTFVFSILSMLFGVLLIAMIAYPLSKKNFKGKKQISYYLYFTMLFSGGLVPSYILITQYLQLSDTILVYILPSLISPWYIFMMRTFFQGIPGEIVESMYIDGALEYTVFFKMILPLSKPVLSTIALFVFLGKWNDWMTSMLYINKENLVSLQYLLQRMMQNIQILQENSNLTQGLVDMKSIPSETVRMAMAIVVAGPALLVFPFFQKYFVKGLTVGSVKG
jgi:putative aldouronate transport system permease protein